MSKHKNSAVVISHTEPRPRKSGKPKLAPAGCRTIEPHTADQIEMNFVKRVELLENGCWLWHGTINQPRAKNLNPVPMFFAATSRADHKLVPAHRYAYEKRIGKLPDQKFFVMRNTCGLVACVNPNHYEIVPRKEILDIEANPALRESLATATKCRNGLHDKTPENTIFVGSAKKAVCHPCRLAVQRAKYHRNKAKKANA
jgi:hypothetical protein